MAHANRKTARDQADGVRDPTWMAPWKVDDAVAIDVVESELAEGGVAEPVGTAVSRDLRNLASTKSGLDGADGRVPEHLQLSFTRQVQDDLSHSSRNIVTSRQSISSIAGEFDLDFYPLKPPAHPISSAA